MTEPSPPLAHPDPTRELRYPAPAILAVEEDIAMTPPTEQASSS